MKPTKWTAQGKKMRQEKRKKMGGEKQKVKVKTVASLLNPKTLNTFCCLHMPELCKLIVCMWIRRLQSARPVNGFMASFSSS